MILLPRESDAVMGDVFKVLGFPKVGGCSSQGLVAFFAESFLARPKPIEQSNGARLHDLIDGYVLIRSVETPPEFNRQIYMGIQRTSRYSVSLYPRDGRMQD